MLLSAITVLVVVVQATGVANGEILRKTMFLSFMQNKSLSHNGFKVKPHALAIYYYISNMCDQHILQLSMS